MKKEDILNLIAKDQISDAIEFFAESVFEKDSLRVEILSLQSRLAAINYKAKMGVISEDNYLVSINQVVIALLSLLDEYELKYNRSNSGILVLKGETSNIPNTIEFLDSLNKMYQGFSLINDLRSKPSRDKDYVIRISSRFNINNYNLDIYKANFSSPGIWEFLGSINPLEQLRQFLNDHFERKMKKEFLHLDKEEKRLKNLELRSNVIKSQIEVLRMAGFEESEVKDLLKTHFVNPIKGLENAIEKGLITGSEIKIKN